MISVKKMPLFYIEKKMVTELVTDRKTDWPTGNPSYRDASSKKLSFLKKKKKVACIYKHLSGSTLFCAYCRVAAAAAASIEKCKVGKKDQGTAGQFSLWLHFILFFKGYDSRGFGDRNCENIWLLLFRSLDEFKTWNAAAESKVLRPIPATPSNKGCVRVCVLLCVRVL